MSDSPPQQTPLAGICNTIRPPCAEVRDFRELAQLMAHCMNCRRDVEGSMSRIGGRQLRKLRSLDECSADKCTAFLMQVEDDSMRLHLSSMAWWRFSAAEDKAAEQVRRIMTACRSREPGYGTDYMHRALRVLSPLSPAQLAVWFGCETLYQAAALFSGDRPALMGKNCHRCRLYKLGCTDYDKLGADDCPLCDDKFVQGVALAVKRAGGVWRNPCNGMDDDGKEST